MHQSIHTATDATMIITASNPEETRQAIVNYIKEQASHYRRKGMIARGKNLGRANLDLANNLDSIAGTVSVAPITTVGQTYLTAKNGE